MVDMRLKNVLRVCLNKCNMKQSLLFLTLFSVTSCQIDDFLSILFPYGWIDCKTEQVFSTSRNELYYEYLGTGNTNNEHQSMAVYENMFFCFESGNKCRVYDSSTFAMLSYCDLEENSHHNNAQMTDIYLREDDKYPLLLLSRGDYPPNKNSFYLVRIEESSFKFSFRIVKTIHNSIKEAQNNGSWIVDSINKYLYLYCMDNGDYRTIEDNHFCIFQFKLPNIFNEETEYHLSYSDVINKWTFPYLVLQGGTCYNGYLLFNVQDLSEIEGRSIAVGKYALLFNPKSGAFTARLPLYESLETEGICVKEDKLFISYKDGNTNHQPDYLMFKIVEYDLPNNLFR